MACVYLAEKDDGLFEQLVAIKIMKPSCPVRDGCQKFRKEQQILASINHPNIAAFYDGGKTKEGEPPSPASDIYQLGLLLYKLITGTIPRPYLFNKYSAGPETDLFIITNNLKKVYRKNFPLIVRENFYALFNNSLNENPRQRYKTVKAFKSDLVNLLYCYPLEARKSTWIYSK